MNFQIVPPTARDNRAAGRHEMALRIAARNWDADHALRSWTNLHYGMMFPRPNERIFTLLAEMALDSGRRALNALRAHQRWAGYSSWFDRIEAGLCDFEAVAKGPRSEMLWEALQLFNVFREVHQIFHDMDVSPDDHVHDLLHRAYEPPLVIVYADHIMWVGLGRIFGL